jgi:hypothetical protein
MRPYRTSEGRAPEVLCSGTAPKVQCGLFLNYQVFQAELLGPTVLGPRWGPGGFQGCDVWGHVHKGITMREEG